MFDSEKKIRGVILDWAGTTVDFGCFAPLNVFIGIFARRGIEISIEEAREPMGLPKIDHIRALLNMEKISSLFVEKFGHLPNESDVRDLYADFEPALMQVLSDYSEPIEGVVDVVSELRARGLKIGSTTGYTTEMMEVVTANAGKKGYYPDALVTPDEVSFGRPYPYMIFKNMEKLEIFPPKSIIKVGDTLSDIKEGLNAGVWSIGVLDGSNEVGLSPEDYKTLPQEKINLIKKHAEERFYRAGADYVIENILNLPSFIDEINQNSKFTW